MSQQNSDYWRALRPSVAATEFMELPAAQRTNVWELLSPPQKREIKQGDLARLFLARKDMLASAMPQAFRGSMDAEGFALLVMQGVLVAISSDLSGKLIACSIESIYEAALQGLRAGLMPGSGQAYLIPYNGVATLQLGWKGLVELIARTGDYYDVVTDVVLKGEEFSFDPLSHEKIRHQYDMGRRELEDYATITKFSFAYAVLVRRDGGPNVAEATSIRDVLRFKPSSSSPAWSGSPRQMARKFALKRLAGRLALDPITLALLAHDDQHHAAARSAAPESDAAKRVLDPLEMEPKQIGELLPETEGRGVPEPAHTQTRGRHAQQTIPTPSHD